MASLAQLPLSLLDGEIVVDFLTAHDQPWLRALVETFDACVGRRQRELRERLAEPLPVPAPWARRQAATDVLRRIFRGFTRAAVPPPRARAALFAEAARMVAGRPAPAARPGELWADRPASTAPPVVTPDRRAILSRAASAAGTTADGLWQSLFADVPGEREITAAAEIPSPSELALRTNLAIVQSLIHRSTRVRIRAEGNVRALVRLAKLRGLICTVIDDPGESGTILDLSGPLSLFRRTLLYGRALADLVPLLAWCSRFHVEAACVVRGENARLVLATGAPIFPGNEPRQFDSALEKRFARDFARAAPDWELLREPQAFRAGGSLMFPDFLVRHRRQPARSFLLEIVGFWTREYLDKKFAALRAAAIPNLILCIDDERNCAEGELPLRGDVIRYRRRIDPADVLRIIDGDQAGRNGLSSPA